MMACGGGGRRGGGGVISLCGGVTLELGGGELTTMLCILLQLIPVLTPDSNLINFNEDQKEVGWVRLFHINKV